jgi:3-oxoacid CoA-transferase subunit A
MDKSYPSAARAVADIGEGASIAVGGFGLVGVPIVLIRALLAQGTGALRIVSNNCGVEGWGLGELLGAGRIARVTASYIGQNKDFARRYLGGELEVELTPQGTLAERMRAGGSGIPAFFTASGVGTLVSEGGLPWRYAVDGSVLAAPSGSTCSRRRSSPTSRWFGRPSATGTATSSSRSRRATSTRWRAWPGASRSPRSTPW